MEPMSVKNAKQAKCAAARFTIAEMVVDIMEMDTNLRLYCEGKARVESEKAGGHFFPYAAAQVKGNAALSKLQFIMRFLEEPKEEST